MDQAQWPSLHATHRHLRPVSTHHVQQVTCHISKTSITTFQKVFDGAIFHCEDKQASSPEYTVLASTIKRSKTPSTTLQSSNPFPKNLLQLLPHLLTNFKNNMANLTLGQVVNSLPATSWPARRRGSKEVDLSCRSSTPPFAPCSTSWPR